MMTEQERQSIRRTAAEEAIAIALDVQGPKSRLVDALERHFGLDATDLTTQTEREEQESRQLVAVLNRMSRDAVLYRKLKAWLEPHIFMEDRSTTDAWLSLSPRLQGPSFDDAVASLPSPGPNPCEQIDTRPALYHWGMSHSGYDFVAIATSVEEARTVALAELRRIEAEDLTANYGRELLVKLSEPPDQVVFLAGALLI